MLYNLHFFSSKCRLFHTATLFGFCITHILNTECAKIWKKKSVAKRLKFPGMRNYSQFSRTVKKRIKTPSASKLAKATWIRKTIFRFSARTSTATLTDVFVAFQVRPDKCRLACTDFQITSFLYLPIALSFDARIYSEESLYWILLLYWTVCFCARNKI